MEQTQEEKKGRNLSWVVYVIIVFVIVDVTSRFLAWSVDMGVCNSGVSFGMLSGLSQTVVIALESALVVFIAIWGLARVEKCLCAQRLGIYLIIAGGISHILSRIIWGCVWDWIELGWGGIYADFADGMIDLGIILVIVGTIAQLFRKPT